jgi:hypothetical protein
MRRVTLFALPIFSKIVVFAFALRLLGSSAVYENSLTTSEILLSRRGRFSGESRERAVVVSGVLLCCGVSQKM